MNSIIIDVREPEEYQSGHVEGALNIQADQLMRGAPLLNEISKDTEIIVYCRSGKRSSAAITILNKLGYTRITNGINKEQVEAKIKQSS